MTPNNIRQTIREAVQKGYKYDPITGTIYGLQGFPLALTMGGSQRYPTVAISVSCGKKSHGVQAHRLVGYFLWGEEIFKPDVQVRHLNGLFDLRACSLTLGTRIENMSDIDPEVRSRAAKAGRAAQQSKNANPKLSEGTVEYIKKIARRDGKGFLLPNELERISTLTGCRKDVVANILRGVTYR
mgnify:CR=1 FL=1